MRSREYRTSTPRSNWQSRFPTNLVRLEPNPVDVVVPCHQNWSVCRLWRANTARRGALMRSIVIDLTIDYPHRQSVLSTSAAGLSRSTLIASQDQGYEPSYHHKGYRQSWGSESHSLAHECVSGRKCSIKTTVTTRLIVTDYDAGD